jgi:transcriptional regulator with XRE-family HTH domain
MDNIEIGKKIRISRENLNLTKRELAKKVGVADSTIKRYEAGEIKKIKIPVIESIANALGVNCEWILGKSEKKKPISNNLTSRDRKEISIIIEDAKEKLLSYEGLMFDGNPASQEAIESIVNAMEIGMELAKKKNKEKYTPKKFKKE